MTNKTPLISIIIPAYNYAHLLGRAVNSVLSQLEVDTELLVINDGSTDSTDSVIKTLQDASPGAFRYLKTENRGLAATRNRGVDETTGNYLVFLDADDELAEQALAIFRQGLTDHPDAKMLASGHYAVKENGKRSYHSPGNVPSEPDARLKAYLLDKTLGLANGAVLMHRSIFDHYRYNQDFRSSEDLPMFAFVLANFQVNDIDKPALVLHKHLDSLRHNVTLAKSVGVNLVAEVFNPDRIPQSAMYLKKAFAIQRYLSLSRTCYLAGDYPGCVDFFKRALSEDFRVLFKKTYASKAIRAYFS